MKILRASWEMLFFVIASIVCVQAQDITKGSIAGVVRDPSSAVVVDATVKLTSPFGDHQTKTNSLGEYLFSNLTPGAGYSVSVEQPGFQVARVSNVSVTLNSLRCGPRQLCRSPW